LSGAWQKVHQFVGRNKTYMALLGLRETIASFAPLLSMSLTTFEMSS
jgi:hypothetical protein